MRGVDGPVRGLLRGEVEPLDEGRRSRVAPELDFESHGIGKVPVPSRCPSWPARWSARWSVRGCR